MDSVLTVTPPRLSDTEALAVAVEHFGVRGDGVRDLGSERDQTFAILDAAGDLGAVLKVSNPGEEPGVLDMEAAAVLHIASVDPDLTVARPWRTRACGAPGPAAAGDPVDGLRGWHAAGGGGGHWVRLYDALPGASRIDATSLDDAALGAWGEMTARLGRALHGFAHPRALRTMVWDVQHALSARTMLPDIADPNARALVAAVLDEYERTVSPVWPRLRAQVIHGDLTVDNTLTDAAGRITGVVDFGDMSHSALVTDVASVLDSVLAGRAGDELFRVARLVLDGYARRTPLEPEELAVVGVLWAARSALTIAISSWRVARGLEAAAFAERYNDVCLGMIETLHGAGWPEVARRLGAEPTAIAPGAAAAEDLAARRAAAFGPTMEPLFYAQPVSVASAEGVWITTTDGKTLLDAYNNVPCVGHGHPRVVEAVARQSRRLNTHMRYLHPAAITLAERLRASCPPELDTVLLVNSGSEANDLAWRMATAVTGRRGGLCTDFAYHGITEATAALSPESWLDNPPPGHVETWAAPDPLRSAHVDAVAYEAAVARLRARGVAPAAAILDGVLTSDGIHDPDPAYVRELVRLTHEAGALWIADEVQAGHGRTGEAMWAFERFGVVPDFVTLGKPMGNGHPVAAVILRGELAAELAGHATLFSTFGGNPVSAAAALAVLDVIADERVLARTREAGVALRDALAVVARAHPGVAEVRGVGLAVGVELVTDAATLAPDGPRGRAVRDRMRTLGVLVGTTGRHGNVLKVRPPLAFTTAEVPVLAEALDQALAETGAG